MTTPSHDQLKTVGEDTDQRSPGFRLLRNPTPRLGEQETEIAFVVERPRSAYRFDIWTRVGCRTGEDAPSLETWKAVFEPRSQPIEVPAWMEALVLEAWDEGNGTDADVSLALEKGVWRLNDESRDPVLAGEGVA